MSHPLTGFHFTATWGEMQLGFTSVTGLDQHIDVIEYREGSSSSLTPRKIPGLVRHSPVILRRGIVVGRADVAEWIATVRMGAIERRDMQVMLLDEDHDASVVWSLRSAWPARLLGPDLDSMKSQVAFETLEVVHEGMTVEFSAR